MKECTQYSRLEHLPNETLLRICRYLSYSDLFYAFANLGSSRFQALVVAARPLVVLSADADLSIIDFFIEHPSNLKVTYPYRMIDFSMFINLRSLHVDLNTFSWHKLDLSLLPCLERLHACDIDGLKVVFNKKQQSSTLNSLQLSIADNRWSLGRKREYRSNPFIRSFTLDAVCSWRTLTELLCLMPALQQLKLTQWLDFDNDVPRYQFAPSRSVIYLDLTLIYAENLIEQSNSSLHIFLPNLERIFIQTIFNKPSQFLQLHKALQGWPKLQRFDCRIKLQWTKHNSTDLLIKTVRALPYFIRIHCRRDINNPNLLVFYTS